MEYIWNIFGLFHLLINGRYLGYNPRILTFDPNFQRDIQAGVHAPNSHIRVCVLFWGEELFRKRWDFLERQPWGCILKHTSWRSFHVQWWPCVRHLFFDTLQPSC